MIYNIEVVTAREYTKAELAAVRRPEYAGLSFSGPRMVGIEVPAAEKGDALFAALNGNDIYLRPKFFAKGFWTALIDIDSGKPVGYIDLDPY